MQYNKDMYDERRRNGEMKAARQDGLAEGLAEGLARGREEGREEGILQMARNMKLQGLSVDIIHKVTGLPTETCESL